MATQLVVATDRRETNQLERTVVRAYWIAHRNVAKADTKPRSHDGRLQDLADTAIRRLLDCVEQAVAREREIETGTGGPAVANAASHVLEKLRDIEWRSRGNSGRNPTIAFGDREIASGFDGQTRRAASGARALPGEF